MGRMIYGKIAESVTKEAVANNACDAQTAKDFAAYYVHCLGRPGMIDYLQQQPFAPPAFCRRPMTGDDRLGNPACTFPIAYAFGDQDFFSSDLGAEDILKLNLEFSGGKSCLFKVAKSSHNIMNCQPDKTTELMVGFFDGGLEGIWEPTLIGDYQWYGEKPKKGFVPREEWVP